MTEQSEGSFYSIEERIRLKTATFEEIDYFMEVVRKLIEMAEEASAEDFFGTEGFKHTLGWD